jgi:hypothetical protein
MYKKTSLLVLVAIFSIFLSWQTVHAQQKKVINYNNQPVLDTDLDGLTDQGEIQIYKTDPNKADTDNDGYDDGVEVLAGTDPLDPKSFPGSPVVAENVVATEQSSVKPAEAPIAWYISRASGIVAFILLYISIFLGLTLRVPFLRKVFLPIYSMNIHCWISVQATLFAFVHGFSLLFDKWLGFSLIEIFVPFASAKFQPGLMTLGSLAFYFMIILIVTSYGRKFMSQKIWRITHFTNLVLYGIVFVHALYLGTDLKIEAVRNIFLYANAFLVLIMLINIELRISDVISRKFKGNSAENTINE